MKKLNSTLNRRSLVRGITLIILLTLSIVLAFSGVISFLIPIAFLVIVLADPVFTTQSASKQILESHSSLGVETAFLLDKPR